VRIVEHFVAIELAQLAFRVTSFFMDAPILLSREYLAYPDHYTKFVAGTLKGETELATEAGLAWTNIHSKS
jgi:hypothetical protein